MCRFRRLAPVLIVALVAALNPVAAGAGIVAPPTDPVINEFSYDTSPGSDVEFVEFLGDASTDYSAFTFLELEGEGTGAGTIDEVISLGTTDGGGFELKNLASNTLENGTLTLLIVEGFSGVAGDDLDTDDDGALDSTPWARVVDGVGINELAAGDFTYAEVELTEAFDDPTYSGSSAGFPPGGASRIPNGTDTDSTADWARNHFFLGEDPEPGEAATTPGATNQLFVVAPVDPVINEVDSDTPGTDTGEFVELFDGGAGGAALDGLVVVHFNGSSDTSYNAFDLDGFNTDTDGYFVLGNAAVSPDIEFPSNGLQNGADAVGLYRADATDFPNGTAVTTTGLVDAFVYDTSDPDDVELLALLNAGQTQINENENGAKDDESNQRCPNGSGAARDTDTYAQFAPTPGAENTCDSTPPGGELGECAAPATPIHDIQGAGPSSTLVGQTVVIEGVVVGDFQDDAINLIAVQEEDADADADPVTSEGILVFEGGSTVPVATGDIVRLLGTVTEFGGVTEISPLSEIVVCEALTGTATAATIDLPVSAVADLEAYEGMGVVFPEELTVTETFQQATFGEVVLSADGRQFNPTNIAPPAPGVGEDLDSDRIIDSLEPGRIILDDLANGELSFGPTDLPPHVDADGTRRAGDTVTGLTGVLDEAFGQYRIRPVGTVPFASGNPPGPAPAVGGDLTVASFNVLNFFETFDTGASVCGPVSSSGCRGADNANELDRQRTKITAAISEMDADVVGLIEIENDATDSLDALLAGLPDYIAVATGTIGDDAIKVGFIYQADTVTPVGAPAILDSSVDPRFIDTKSRPALAQTFEHNATGDLVTVVVNHLKSKGSSCADVGDPTSTNGQGNCNGTRTMAAEAMADWLATDPTGSGDPDVLIIGDLNSYANEDPIVALETAGYTDLVEQFVPAPERYSFIFGGASGYLDHGLANPPLAPKVAGTAIWHINADEPRFRDYNDDILDAGENPFSSEGDLNPAAAFQPDAFRASDHDPVLIGLNMEAPSLRQQLRDLADELDVAAGGDTRIERAARLIRRSTLARYWDDDNTLSRRGKTVFSLHVTVARVLQPSRSDPAITEPAKDALFSIDRQIVVGAIDAAIARGGRPRFIFLAEVRLALADSRAASGFYPGTFKALRDAWKFAEKA